MNRREIVTTAPAAVVGGSYIPFVDGLRAVSILSVVLYHAGLTTISGGYVGVDIFFVISGYLIINQIVEGLRKGSFRFADFWARRALRILPPYLLVIATSAVIAPFILVMPEEFTAFAREVRYSALMVANHLFLSQQGYFDQASDTKVLLHLWSLAVEEQFYLVAPLLLFALWRLRGAYIAAAAMVLFAASLAGCIYWTGLQGDKNYAFFLMPLRAWEFIAGGAVAALIPFMSRLPRLASEALGMAGLGAIIYAVLVFSTETPFPSWRAAVPVVGAAAIILAGLANPSIVVARVLAVRPMVFIGLVSYSWYLWHWPLLTFARIRNFGDRLPWLDVSMVLLSFALAALTRYAVEKPVLEWRKRRFRQLNWTPVFSGLVACVVVAVAGGAIFQSRAAAIASNTNMIPEPPGALGPCQLNYMKDPGDCAKGLPLGILIGDSHAASASRVLAHEAEEAGTRLTALTGGGCISVLGLNIHIPDTARAERCRNARANTVKLLSSGSLTAEYAILYSSWGIYTNGGAYGIVPPGSEEPTADAKPLFVAEMHNTIDLLKQAGVDRVLVIAPTPIFDKLAPTCVMKSDHYDLDRAEMCAVPRQREAAARAAALDWLHSAVSGLEGVRLVDPFDLFCDDRFCYPYSDNAVLFTDTNHLSDAGVQRISGAFATELSWLFPD